MTARSAVLIGIALLLAVGTIMMMRGYLAGKKQPINVVKIEKEVETKVLVARADLPAGTILGDQHLRWQVWPDQKLPESYYVLPKGKKANKTAPKTIKEDLYGSVVRRGIAAGQPIVKGLVVKSGTRGYLAAVLRPGYRAFTIKISATSGIAGLIFPGDRVDLMMTHKVKVGKKGQKVTETILKNVRILALDQMVNDQKGQAKLRKTATMEVTRKQAEMLAVADQLGRLSLSLRSLALTPAEERKLKESGRPLDEPNPVRGWSYTTEAEASALIGSRGGAGVSVTRGRKTKIEGFR